MTNRVRRHYLICSYCCLLLLPAATADGSDAIISWSKLYALYRLPDGSTWAEHSYLHDADDVRARYEGSGGVWYGPGACTEACIRRYGPTITFTCTFPACLVFKTIKPNTFLQIEILHVSPPNPYLKLTPALLSVIPTRSPISRAG